VRYWLTLIALLHRWWQIVSSVEGKLAAGKTPYDLTCRGEREHGGCARRFQQAQ
jgi:hypothetical protein